MSLTMIHIFIVLILLYESFSQNPRELPLAYLSDINGNYTGAFRIPHSGTDFPEGKFAIDPKTKHMFLIGDVHYHAIGEFEIPEPKKSSNIEELNLATNIQPFQEIFDRSYTGNIEGKNRAGGVYVKDNEVIVTAYTYYDATGIDKLQTLVIRDKNNLESSVVDGFFEVNGKDHVCGWISDIPYIWQSIFEGTHFMGWSAGDAIITRFSVGPSAFAIDINDLVGNSKHEGTIDSIKALDYSAQNIIGGLTMDEVQKNTAMTNDLWTVMTQAVVGFVIPGTRTYATIGRTAGHNCNICYKCYNDVGHLCGGSCPYISSDRQNYYWLFDLNDMMEVKNGTKNSYDVMPYAYGVFPNLPMDGGDPQTIIGGYFDSTDLKLYLSVKTDTEQGTYSCPPYFLVFQVNGEADGINPKTKDDNSNVTATVIAVFCGIGVVGVIILFVIVFVVALLLIGFFSFKKQQTMKDDKNIEI